MQEIYEIIRLAKDYIAVGIVLAAAFLVGYFLMHIKRKTKTKNQILFGLFSLRLLSVISLWL